MSSGTYGEYGALIVCGDYEGNLNAIAKVLNRFEYDQGDERLRFVVHDGRIEPNNFGNETMSAFPLRVWLISKDGRRIPGDEQCDHEDGGWDIRRLRGGKFGGAEQDNCAIADARHFGVGFDQALQDQVYLVPHTCDPFGWLGATPKRGIQELSA